MCYADSSYVPGVPVPGLLIALDIMLNEDAGSFELPSWAAVGADYAHRSGDDVNRHLLGTNKVLAGCLAPWAIATVARRAWGYWRWGRNLRCASIAEYLAAISFKESKPKMVFVVL